MLISEKMNAAHARWRDGILAHHIVDVRHVPGKLNVVADGMSRTWEGMPQEPGDGSKWTVSEDWEHSHGLRHDLFAVNHHEPSTLWKRFHNEPVFQQVVEALEDNQVTGSLRTKQRARHRAVNYAIEDRKLWHSGAGPRAQPRVECVTREEATNLAHIEHEKGGHWGRDSVKIALLDRIYSPKLDESITNAIKSCSQCKNFGGTHLHSLLQPITRRHPFELIVGDYLSLPSRKGGYHTIGLYLDTFSQHAWAFKYKTARSAKTMKDGLRSIFHGFLPPETFMTDGGPHFKNHEVKDFCMEWGVKHHVVPAYSPWVNGLVEGTNRLLLHVLKWLCAPELGEDLPEGYKFSDLPRSWPDHLDEAICCLNSQILPALKYMPKELLLGMMVNTASTAVEDSSSVLCEDDAHRHLAFVAQQQLDGYDSVVRHAIKHKTAFDARVLAHHPREVIFKKGQLVQVYRSNMDYTFRTEKKLIPKWSAPLRIQERIVNSYQLETLEGKAVEGNFSSCCLRSFTPREGTRLAAQQAELEKQLQKEEEDRAATSDTDVDTEEQPASE